MGVFDLSGLAKLAGVSVFQARNWTSGRPLRIKPSVRIRKVERSRSLFSETEVFMMAIANRLRHGGVVFHAIKAVLDKVAPEDFIRGNGKWLFVVVEGRETQSRVCNDEELEEEIQRQCAWAEISDPKCTCHFLEISHLLSEVQGRIDAYSGEDGQVGE